MCVLRVRARGEPDGLVASGEADVKPADEGVDVVVARRRQSEGCPEGEVGFLHRLDINFLGR
ncbi:hypothetical protein BC938DRAFT_471062 [Jimgerdemannia flammicorona]|uniref:Uncharacterized protein n=1 Tax=Jimgerdemannia flammicorona TaxID=994334 RepID=A0A433QUU8_9FUNG|nr:hypothetical protein BC938DRAFT_471062 [Jimgerdemannia flammicorona]